MMSIDQQTRHSNGSATRGDARPLSQTLGFCSALKLFGGAALLLAAGHAQAELEGVSGSASGAASQGAESGVEYCDQTLGTISIEEDTRAGWYSRYSRVYGTGSTVPALRLLVQQSNCFVIVDRGRGLQAGKAERELIRGDEGRAGSNFGGGQIVAADYVMIPEVLFAEKGANKLGAAAGGLMGKVGLGGFSSMVGKLSSNEASTMLTLVDNRSSVQISASQGQSKNYDFGVGGVTWGDGMAGGASAFTSTNAGKVVLAAFVDSYNGMVRSLRNYRAQTVKGGLGAGGRLGVQGGQTDASMEVGP